MVGRFLFQKLSSRISSRSRSLSLRVGAHASASDIAAPVCRVSEGRSGTLSSFLHGSAAHSSMPNPSYCVIHRCAARYFNTLPWTRSAAKTSRPTNGMPSAVAHRAKPTFVDSAGVKRTFSSDSHTKDTVTWEAKRAAWEAEREAENKAHDDEFKASKTKLDDEFKAWKTKPDK